MREFDQAIIQGRMDLEREMLNLEQNGKWIKMELEKTKAYETLAPTWDREVQTPLDPHVGVEYHVATH